MSLVLVLHDRLSVATALFTFAMGAWALWSALRGRSVDGSFYGALVLGVGLLLAEAAAGAILWLGAGARPDRAIHLLYGVMAVLLWPFVMTLVRREGTRREAVLMAASSFFLWGMVMRAIGTAGGG